MPLSDTAIRNAQPRQNAYKLADGSGLTLLINPNGSKWWRLRYRVNGREKMLSVGTYPDVSLKRARERRDEARRLIADNIDPSLQRLVEKTARSNTFEAIANEWMEMQQKRLAAVTLRLSRASIDMP